ncbi:alanine/glycine:cation symporter family protein [Alkaliphilus peptidifermentans]|uniref:Alanine or glycine:cation symporter, AGCS family n=1 Tax=Alkaliphilus peptidifermentans DSM 18978 TaxID=1120976 RepID=A0A1G5IHQ6_9FIRM|nr:sodium:alanine symporter family protein [Alkaliphilus peptidifermentans]SCY75705.1 alanine or glycine:cation symporter, AGCS family [Alkaliphilus peptidifermentans DSM 18978]
MDMLMHWIGVISDWLWGPPLIILLVFGGLYLTVKLGFFQFKYVSYIFSQTFGKMFKKHEGGEGTVSPFQALTAAIACTVGAGNIVGVPAAIMFGGPGAIFWMWVIALVGMGAKFTEVVLAVKYREKNEEGEFVGGPQYYINKGLNKRWLAVWFALGLMIEVIPSIMVQANSVAASAAATFNINPSVSGILALVVVGLIVIGGIKRIGKFTEKYVPLMAFLYIGTAFLVIMLNFRQIPSVIGLIFTHAFRPMAPVGGFAGAVIASTIRWGFARGVYSNESGLGTAPIAHASAITDHPVRQGLWSVAEVFVDTIVICSATAFAVLVSGVWTSPGAMDNASGLTAIAFSNALGNVGGMIVTISLLLFVISTIVVLIYYGEKQAEFLLGLKFSRFMKYIYVASIFIGAIGGAKIIWQFLDITLAAIVIPNMIAILLLSSEVIELKNEFFTSTKYYLKDIGKSAERSS